MPQILFAPSPPHCVAGVGCRAAHVAFLKFCGDATKEYERHTNCSARQNQRNDEACQQYHSAALSSWTAVGGNNDHFFSSPKFQGKDFSLWQRYVLRRNKMRRGLYTEEKTCGSSREVARLCQFCGTEDGHRPAKTAGAASSKRLWAAISEFRVQSSLLPSMKDGDRWSCQTYESAGRTSEAGSADQWNDHRPHPRYPIQSARHHVG